MDSRRTREVFNDVHAGLPRQGPGNRTSTERALNIAGPVPPAARILDVACGPGMQTLDLADLLTAATIIGVDAQAEYLQEGARQARGRGIADRVEFAHGDMRALEFAPGSFDLIWCEGAAYIMGLANALRSWRSLLKPGGRIALSEAVWLRGDPPEDLRAWWSLGYPDMRDVAGCREVVADCGYQLLGDFVLPQDAWWEHYYGPMAVRLEVLAPKYAGDVVAEAVLQQCRDEIAFYRDYSACYGYVFLVMGS